MKGLIAGILFAYAVSFGAALIYAASITPEYEAMARLVMKDPTPREFGTALASMRGTDIIMRVAKRLTAEERKTFLTPYQHGNIYEGPLNFEEVLAAHRDIVPEKQSTVIVVRYRHPDRATASRVADYFVREIVGAHEAEAHRAPEQAFLYYEKRLADTELAIAASRASGSPESERIRKTFEIRQQALAKLSDEAKNKLTERSGLRVLDGASASARPVNVNPGLLCAIAAAAGTLAACILLIIFAIRVRLRPSR